MVTRGWLVLTLCCLLQGCASMIAPDSSSDCLRVATYNASMYTEQADGLYARLSAGDDPQAQKIAAVIQRTRPDVLLLNEFDFESDGRSAALFQRDYLERSQQGADPIHYPHVFQAPVNTGMPSGLDLDGDGRNDGPGDAWGFGRYPGQYGMLVLSRYPIDRSAVRSFQHLRWSSMPGALQPQDAQSGQAYFPAHVWAQLRLSSKSHWDVPIQTPLGTLHLLAMHPTPPVFDGPEDRNGRRNHDEIRLFADYLGGLADQTYLVDDAGTVGGLSATAAFVLVGDFNADPLDGDSWPGAIQQLLKHPSVNSDFVPTSAGASAAEQQRVRETPLRGDAAAHTSSFGLRVDYVLPSHNFSIRDGGVFWPEPHHPDAVLVEGSDHRLVWLDLERRAD